MDMILFLLFLIFFVLFVVALISPKAGLFWIAAEKRSRSKSLYYLLASCLCLFVFIGIAEPPKDNTQTEASNPVADFDSWSRKVEGLKTMLAHTWDTNFTQAFAALEAGKIDTVAMGRHLEQLDADCKKLHLAFFDIKTPDSLSKEQQEKMNKINKNLATAIHTLKNVVSKTTDMLHNGNIQPSAIQKDMDMATAFIKDATADMEELSTQIKVK